MSIRSKPPFPTIDLGDYILREKTIADAADFLEYYADPEVNKYIVSDIPKNIEESKQELAYWINVYYYNDGIYFAIARKDNNKLIGSIGLSSYNKRHNRIEASYDLNKKYWNKGITTKALKALVKYGFEELKINRIEAYSIKENYSSRKVLLKSGFELEGELREHRKHNGIYKDIGVFSVINPVKH